MLKSPKFLPNKNIISRNKGIKIHKQATIFNNKHNQLKPTINFTAPIGSCPFGDLAISPTQSKLEFQNYLLQNINQCHYHYNLLSLVAHKSFVDLHIQPLVYLQEPRLPRGLSLRSPLLVLPFSQAKLGWVWVNA